jgi:hypothetical protein
LVVAGGALGLFALPVDAGLIVSSQNVNFAAAGYTYGGFLRHADFPILSGSDGVSVGGVVDGGPAGKYGAEASASAGADISASLSASQFSRYDLTYKSAFTTGVVWDAAKVKPNVGDSIFLTAAAAPVGITKLNIKDDGLRAALELSENITLSAGGRACVYACIGFTLGVNIGGPSHQNLVSINEGGSGSLKVLGATVSNVLPYTYASPDGSIKMTADVPNFSSTVVKAPTLGVGHYNDEKNVFSAGVDVAQLFATAIGLPFPLKGDLGGFDYTLLLVLATVGTNLKHDFTLTPKGVDTVYKFSSPVRVRDPVTGLFSTPVDAIALAPGETVEIRAAGLSQTLGIVPEHRLAYGIAADWNVLPFVSGALEAIRVAGYGLEIGPALSVEKKFTITEIDLYDVAFDTDLKTVGKPLNVFFDPLVVLSTGETINVCATEECLATGFLPETSEAGGGWTEDTIYRVTALDHPLCGIGGIALCGVDFDTTPSRTQRKRSIGPGGVEEDYAEDGELLEALLAMEDLIDGPSSNEEAVRLALQALGFDPDNLILPPFLGTGAPPLTEPVLEDRFAALVFVPEPSALWLVAPGLLALVGAGVPLRRRSPQAE